MSTARALSLVVVSGLMASAGCQSSPERGESAGVSAARDRAAAADTSLARSPGGAGDLEFFDTLDALPTVSRDQFVRALLLARGIDLPGEGSAESAARLERARSVGLLPEPLAGGWAGRSRAGLTLGEAAQVSVAASGGTRVATAGEALSALAVAGIVPEDVDASMPLSGAGAVALAGAVRDRLATGEPFIAGSTVTAGAEAGAGGAGAAGPAEDFGDFGGAAPAATVAAPVAATPGAGAVDGGAGVERERSRARVPVARSEALPVLPMGGVRWTAQPARAMGGPVTQPPVLPPVEPRVVEPPVVSAPPPPPPAPVEAPAKPKPSPFVPGRPIPQPKA